MEIRTTIDRWEIAGSFREDVRLRLLLGASVDDLVAEIRAIAKLHVLEGDRRDLDRDTQEHLAYLERMDCLREREAEERVLPYCRAWEITTLTYGAL